MNINDEWLQYLLENNNNCDDNDYTFSKTDTTFIHEEETEPSSLYISTKTKIAFISQPIDIASVFWDIPLIEYSSPCEGFVKKQTKFNCLTPAESQFIADKLSKVNRKYDEKIITKHSKSGGANKVVEYKDVRKISVGICKKDIFSNNSQEKSAFYNCIVLETRLLLDESFREIHVKLFNTGKIEIPGVKQDPLFDQIIDKLEVMITAFLGVEIKIDRTKIETILINSDFNCGYYIKRESLIRILSDKYNIPCIFDSCSYPGIKCKHEFQYKMGNSARVSFMIFRTGSVLIVGKCEEEIIYQAYELIRQILVDERMNILQPNALKPIKNSKIKQSKQCKKLVTFQLTNN